MLQFVKIDNSREITLLQSVKIDKFKGNNFVTVSKNRSIQGKQLLFSWCEHNDSRENS